MDSNFSFGQFTSLAPGILILIALKLLLELLESESKTEFGTH